MTYLIKLSLVWGLLYLLYNLSLKKLTFFRTNRFFLLGSILAGLILPLLEVSIPWMAYAEPAMGSTTIAPVDWQQIDSAMPIILMPATEGGAETTDHTPAFRLPWWLVLYLVGALLALSRLTYGLYRLYGLFRSGQKIAHKAFQIVRHPDVQAPFSFFGLIFWDVSTELNSPVGHHILRHEKAHIDQAHSWDILLLELLQIIFWFHPLVYLYRRSIQQVHEYLADADVLRETAVRTYGRILLGQGQGPGRPMPLAQPFSQSQLKNRILMMKRQHSPSRQGWRYALVLPLLAGLLFLFSTELTGQNEQVEQTRKNHGIPILSPLEVTYNLREGQTLPEPILGKQQRELPDGVDPLDVAFRGWMNISQITQMLAPNDPLQVDIDFVITREGRLSDVNIISSQDNPQAVDRLRQAMRDIDQWKPSLLNGHPVDFPMSLSCQIRFEKSAGDYLKDLGEEVVLTADRMPQFAEGDCQDMEGRAYRDCNLAALYQYVQANLRYPLEARDARIEGKVVADFVVRKDGSIFKPTIIKDIGGGTAEEVLRLINNMPDWQPGLKNGQPVHVQMRLPVNFRLRNQEAEEAKEAEDDILMVVENMPRFAGTETKKESDQAFFDYLVDHLRYPEVARKEGVEGTTVVEFVIEKDGSVTNVKLLRDVGAGLGEEAVRVIKDLPKWIPGQQNGKEVRVLFRAPVRFKLPDETEAAQSVDLPELPNNTLPADAFTVSPNPSRSRIEIQFRDPLGENDRIRLLNQNGQLENMVAVEPPVGTTHRAVTFSRPGVYFVQLVKADGKMLTKKVIVQ